MRSGSALLLRLAGPLIQVVCLILLFSPGSQGWSVGGVAAQKLFYAGFGVGFLIWAVGLILYRPEHRRPRP
jgi:hypothetical protein